MQPELNEILFRQRAAALLFSDFFSEHYLFRLIQSQDFTPFNAHIRATGAGANRFWHPIVNL